MSRFQYQATTEPVLVPAPPSAPSFGWFAPLATPILPRSRIPSQATQPLAWEPDTLPFDPCSAPATPWDMSFSLMFGPNTGSGSFCVSQWFKPFNEPQRGRYLSAALMTMALTWSGFTPSTVVIAPFIPAQWTEAPRRSIAHPSRNSTLSAPVSIPPSLGWLPSFDIVLRPPRPQLASGWVAPLSTSPETVSEDRWHQPFSLPVWPKRGLAAYEHQSLAWSGFTPTPPTFTSLGWLPSFEVPRLPQRSQPASGGVGPLSTAPETTSVDRWYEPLSLPVRTKIGLGVAYDPAFSWSAFTPPATAIVWGWLPPIEAPRPPQRSIPSSGSVAPVSTNPETTTVDRWYQNLSRPPGAKPGLTAAAQASAIWSNFSPAPPISVSVAGWFVNLTSPYPARRGLGAPYQQAYFSYVSMLPGTVVPAAPTTIPGPSDGGEDDRRRKWLEWSRQKRSKQRPVTVTLPTPPAPIAVDRQLAKPDTLLAANLVAIKAQQEDNAIRLMAILKAEQIKKQQDDDDDEALSLLLGE